MKSKKDIIDAIILAGSPIKLSDLNMLSREHLEEILSALWETK